MTKMKDLTDEELMKIMLSSKTVQEWNDHREVMKGLRDTQWIIENIDMKGVINKSQIPKPIIKEDVGTESK